MYTHAHIHTHTVKHCTGNLLLGNFITSLREFVDSACCTCCCTVAVASCCVGCRRVATLAFLQLFLCSSCIAGKTQLKFRVLLVYWSTHPHSRIHTHTNSHTQLQLQLLVGFLCSFTAPAQREIERERTERGLSKEQDNNNNNKDSRTTTTRRQKPPTFHHKTINEIRSKGNETRTGTNDAIRRFLTKREECAFPLALSLYAAVVALCSALSLVSCAGSLFFSKCVFLALVAFVSRSSAAAAAGEKDFQFLADINKI